MVIFKEIMACSLTQGGVGMFIGVYLVGNNIIISSYGELATAACTELTPLKLYLESDLHQGPYL